MLLPGLFMAAVALGFLEIALWNEAIGDVRLAKVHVYVLSTVIIAEVIVVDV